MLSNHLNKKKTRNGNAFARVETKKTDKLSKKKKIAKTRITVNESFKPKAIYFSKEGFP